MIWNKNKKRTNILENKINSLEQKLQKICNHNNYKLDVNMNVIFFECLDCEYYEIIFSDNKRYKKYLKEYKKRKIKELGDLK